MRKGLKLAFHLPKGVDVDVQLHGIANGEFVRDESEEEEGEDLPGNAGESVTPAEREVENQEEEDEEEEEEEEEDLPPPEHGEMGVASTSPLKARLVESVVQPRTAQPVNLERRVGRRSYRRNATEAANAERSGNNPATQSGAMEKILQTLEGLTEKVAEIDQRTRVPQPPPDQPVAGEREIDWIGQLAPRMGQTGEELRDIRPVRTSRVSRQRDVSGGVARRAQPAIILYGRQSRRSRRNSRRRRGDSSESSDDADSEFGVIDNEEFWELFKETPFKNPVLRVDELVGENMLRLALTDHPGVSSYVDSIQWRDKSRNRHEARKLARMVDFNIGELGMDCVRKMGSTEIAMRRLSALQVAEKQGGWTLANHIDESVSGLLTARRQRHMLAAARLEQRLGSLGGGSAAHDDAPRGDGKKKAPGAE